MGTYQLTERDLGTLLDWGFRIYPSVCLYDHRGQKLPPMFPASIMGKNFYTEKCDWWLALPQKSPKELTQALKSGYKLTGVIPKNIIVFDVDGKLSYESVVRLVGTKKLIIIDSFSENHHHMYFKTTKPFPPFFPFTKLGIMINGGILGFGHLVTFNIDGWDKPVPKLKHVPVIPIEFYNQTKGFPKVFKIEEAC